MKTRYVLIPWPESQDLIDENWFKEEAVLHPDESASFFIPEERYNEHIGSLHEASNKVLQMERFG